MKRRPVGRRDSNLKPSSMLEIAELRRHVGEQRAHIEEGFLKDQRPEEALSKLTQVMDNVIEELASKLLSDLPVSLFAIGGYGRRELYPASDLDLLVLYPHGVKRRAEPAAARLLQNLWDLKLSVGQQVWSWEDLDQLSVGDFEFILALLDARLVSGDEATATRLLSDFLPQFLNAHRAALVQRILERTRQRHSSFQNTIYHLEPDLKQAPGGLRDYQVGCWLTRISRGRVLPPWGSGRTGTAHRFLARLRLFLHLLTGRNQNQLTHQLQASLVSYFGYGQATVRSGVESLMKEYFLQARVIRRFCQSKLHRHTEMKVSGIRLQELSELGPMTGILDAFLMSIREERPLSAAASQAIAEGLPAASQRLSYPVLAPRILELLRPRPGLYRALSAMDELGILELLFPEFGSIKARVIRDFYHEYTVDEHTLQAVKAVEELKTSAAESPEAGDGRFRGLLGDIQRPEILILALLLHDVGKSRSGKHVDASARMAARALRRFRLDKELVNTTVFLIRHHLAMSGIMFRRNLEDPQVVSRFSDLVGDTEKLRLLCLLTYADIKAVAPQTLNEWKKDRLWQLYVAAYNQLTLGYGRKRIEEEDIGQKLRASLPPGLDAEGFDDFLEGFPLRYLTTTPAEEIYEHYRLGSQLHRSGESVQIRLRRRHSHFELCVVTVDTYHLFARIVGLLSYFDMNILRGYGFSNRRGIVLDFFQFVDTRQVFELNPSEQDRFQALLRAVIKEQLSVRQLLARKEHSIVFQPAAPKFEPSARFVDEDSGDYSIMEIVAPDAIGLLYRVGREISRLGCNIELILISTEGDKAVDVFYLTSEGAKLKSELRKLLVQRIVAAIG